MQLYVKIQHDLSSEMDLKYGVTQGSVLGLLLFILYISDIYEVINYHNLNMHLYGNNTQAYTGINPLENISTRLDSVVFFIFHVLVN